MIIKRKRQKTSPIWLISKEELQEVVKNSQSIADILRYYGYGVTGGTHPILKNVLKKIILIFLILNLDANLMLEENLIFV